MLISFWGVRVLSLLGAMKGAMLNRFFDIFIMGFVVLNMVCVRCPSVHFVAIHLMADYAGLISVVMFTMVSVKCLAIGVHAWLPDAMEGPTVVSALIHAATLVILGVV